MTLRSPALVVFATLALASGAVLTPSLENQCRSLPFLTEPLCAAPDHAGLVARGLARRSVSAGIPEGNAVVHLLTSSPLLGVDFRPLREFTLWWLEQTGKAVMARHPHLHQQ